MSNHHCCICLESIVDGGTVGSTNCGHCFHTDCFTPWRTKSHRCPTCNATVNLFHPLYIDFAAILSVDDDDDESIDMEEENDEEEMDDDENNGENSAQASSSKKRRPRGGVAVVEDDPTVVVIDDDIAIVEKKKPSPAKSRKLSKYKLFVKRQRATIASLQKHVDQLKSAGELDAAKLRVLGGQNRRLEDELKRSEEEIEIEQEERRQKEVAIQIMERELETLRTQTNQMAAEITQLKSQRKKESSTEMLEFKRYMKERPSLMAELKLLRENAANHNRGQAQAGICKKQKRQMLQVLGKQCEQQKMSAPKRKQTFQMDSTKYANRSLQLVHNGLDRTKPPKASVSSTNPLSSLATAPKRSTSFATHFLR